MITGTVTANREAVIHLEVKGPNLQVQCIEAVIDTGFNGFLTLPNSLIISLGLPLVGNRRAMLGDGNTVVLDVYLAIVIWHEQEREVLALQADGGPLVGMSLLYGSRLTLDISEDGAVCIEQLSTSSPG